MESYSKYIREHPQQKMMMICKHSINLMVANVFVLANVVANVANIPYLRPFWRICEQKLLANICEHICEQEPHPKSTGKYRHLRPRRSQIFADLPPRFFDRFFPHRALRSPLHPPRAICAFIDGPYAWWWPWWAVYSNMGALGPVLAVLGAAIERCWGHICDLANTFAGTEKLANAWFDHLPC